MSFTWQSENPTGVARQQVERLAVALHNPEEIELHRHQLGIRTLEQHLVRHTLRRLPGRNLEFEGVVVVPEPQAGLATTLTQLIELVGNRLVVGERLPIGLFDPRNNHVAHAEGARRSNLARRVVAHLFQ